VHEAGPLNEPHMALPLVKLTTSGATAERISPCHSRTPKM